MPLPPHPTEGRHEQPGARRRCGKLPCRPWLACHWLAAAAMLAGLSAGAPVAADQVLLRSASTPGGRQRVEGTIEEYNGRELVLVDAAGKRRRFKGQQVVRIEAQWTAEQVAGNEHLARRQYSQAVRSFLAAARRETRAWVRRLITARLVEAYREMGEYVRACELFIELTEADPETPWFDVAPLAWVTANPGPVLEERARQWLQDDERPAAVLLAASHLLLTASHEQALARLDALAEAKDPRYRALARAQRWRAALAKAGVDLMDRWSLEVVDFPPCAVPGAAVVLARAYAAGKQEPAAALWGLCAALLYPEQASLAAEGLWQAGTALERLGEASAAASVLAELAARYPDHRLAGPALERVQALDPSATAAPQALPSHPGEGATSPMGAEATAVRFAAGDGPAERFALLASALRERRLHSILAWYAEWLSLRLPADDPRQVELVCERCRSLVDQALESPAHARAPLWQQAAAVVEEFAQRFPDHPRLVLVEVQAGLVQLVQGELGREELLASGTAEGTEEVRARLREAVRRLQAADEHLQRLLRSPPNKPETALSSRELLALAQQVAFQLARAYRNQGLAYEADSADRINALRQAQELLAPLAQLDPDHALAWPARLNEIQCLRLLGDLEQARVRLDLLMKSDMPEHVRQAALAEGLRLALACGDLDQAVSLAQRTGVPEGAAAPDLDLALLEVWLAAWQRATGGPGRHEPLPNAEASPDPTAQEYRDRAAALVRAIGRHGPYWSRRAEALLASGAANLAANGDADLVRRAAAGLFRKGQLEQALQALIQARDAAIAAGNTSVAFEAGFLAAAMLESSGRSSEAALQYRSAALADPAHPRAPEAHLQAVYLAGRSPTGHSDAEAHRALLEEHLRTWPQAATAMQARVWLGRLHELAGAWEAAVAAYQQVPLDDALGSEALTGAARAYASWLSERAQSGQEVGALAAAAGDSLARLVEPSPGTFPMEWSPAQRDAALAAARLWLLYAKDRFRQAERLLSAAMSGAPPAPAEWQAAAQGWLVFALAAQGQRVRAQELVAQLAHSAPGELMALVFAVDPLLASAAREGRSELGTLQFGLLSQLQQHLPALGEHEQGALALCRLRALLAAERFQDALAEAQRAERAWPDSGKVQQGCAELLTEFGQPELVQHAARRWQQIIPRLSPGTARWARANYYLAFAYERLGQKKKAAAVVRYVQRLYPSAGDDELRARYAALLKRCQ